MRLACCRLSVALVLTFCGCSSDERGRVETGPLMPPPRSAAGPATLPMGGTPLAATAPSSAAGPAASAEAGCRPPVNVVARAGADAQRVELTWQKPFVEPETYLLERATDGKNFARIAIVSGSASSCVDAHDLTPQTTYTYRLRSWIKGQVSDASAPAHSRTCNFSVFDSTLFLNKPNLAGTGFQPLHVVYEEQLFKVKTQWERRAMDADPVLTAEAAREAAKHGNMMVIDIECWPMDIRDVDRGVAKQSMQRMLNVMKWAQAAAPGLRIGVYGLPMTTRLHPDKMPPERIQQEDEANEFLRPLYTRVDALFPSLYTLTDDRSEWLSQASHTLAVSRRFGRPVYPFLMPVYPEFCRKEIASMPVPPEYWELELRTLRAKADGAVIWGGYQQQWDANAPWWRVTQRFVQPVQLP